MTAPPAPVAWPTADPSVTLVPLAPEHAPRVQELASDPAIGATSNVPSPYPADGARQWIAHSLAARAEGREYAFAVTHAEHGLVGACSLLEVDLAAAHGTLGYWIGTPYWRHGFASLAARAALEFGARHLGLRRVSACCLDRNPASDRVLLKVGFRFTSTCENEARGLIRNYVWNVEPGEG